jgi:hypothetical protein
MDCYIVRIYRRERGEPDRIAGIVELVGSQEKQSFATLVQLIGILNPSQEETDPGREKEIKQKGEERQ